MVYEFFNNTFPYDCGKPALNLPPIIIDDTPRPHKRDRYTPDLLLYYISVDSENYVSTLTTNSYLTRLILLPYDSHNPTHATKKYKPYPGRLKIG